MLGDEFFANLGFPEQEWRPKLYNEAFSYWTEALARLAKLALRHDSLAEVAKNEISHHIRELTSVGRVNELDELIRAGGFRRRKVLSLFQFHQ